MQQTRKQSHRRLATKCHRTVLLLQAFVFLWAGAGWSLAQTVRASVWSSEMDHSLQSVLVFQSQIHEEAEARVRVYDEILAQQIARIDLAPAASSDGGAPEVSTWIDQEADAIILNPLQSGAEAIEPALRSNLDFLLITQLSRAVKPHAYRMASGVEGSADLETLAFLNPDGTHVLFTVNHSRLPVSLEGYWNGRMFSYTQAGRSIGLFAWDPKRPLVSLVPKEKPIFADGVLSIEAACFNVSPLGFDVRCESQAYCSVVPAHFSCSSQQSRTMLNVTACSIGKNPADHKDRGFVTITAAPDAGPATSLRVPCRSGGP